MKIAINDRFVTKLVRDKRYEVRADGSIWTTVTRTGKNSLNAEWRKLAFIESSSGHLFVKYQYKLLAIHRIVFRVFKGKLRRDFAVNHIDGDKRNNTPANLELITHSENMLHCWRVLKHIPMKPRAKITQEIANEIRKSAANGFTNRELRERYRLSKSSVSGILNGKTWS